MRELMAPTHLQEETVEATVGLSLDASNNEEEDGILIGSDCSQPPNNSSDHSSTRINWALAYSSDEDSQKAFPHQRLRRSCSDPSLRDGIPMVPDAHPFCSVTHRGPRQRSRSSCSHQSEEDAPLNESIGGSTKNDGSSRSLRPDENLDTNKNDDERKGKTTTRRSSFLQHAHHVCTPVRFLSVLFVLTCYTTFWLPYPGVKPTNVYLPRHTPKLRQQPSIPHTQLPKHSDTSNAVNASPALFHARAPAEMELNLKYRPGLDKFYEQEAFSSRAWTRDVNILALGTVLIFLLWERNRRVGAADPATEEGGGGEEHV